MNNLKRILSLALASVMVMGMMATSASAADFSDAEDITHTAAVDTMAALEIIKGMDDGSFNPNGDVTRAQMAKMITVAVNGKEPNLGKPTSSTFADSASHWALEYIEYCANLGIINGRSATEFDPEGKVTAAEAAKMILVALGFDAEIFELTGANWSKNTMSLAQTLRIGSNPLTAKTLNLFGGLGNIGANTPLNRDQAAQLIYNGIQANTVVMSLSGVTAGTQTGVLGTAAGQTPTYQWSLTGPSILTEKFGATVVEGVMTAATITPATSSNPLAANYTVTYTSGVDAEGNPTVVTPSFDTDFDVSDLLMQNVRLIYTGKGNSKNVLTITSASDDVLSSGAWGGLDMTPNAEETIVRLDGYSVKDDDASGLDIYNTETLTQVDDGDITDWDGFCDEYKLIDNNGDGVVDCVLVTPVTLATVKRMNSKTMTLAKTSSGSISVTLATDMVEAGLAEGDYVTVTKSAAGVQTVKKAETLTAKVDASRATGDITTLRVGGKWYTVADSFTSSDLSIGSDAAKLNNKECNLVLVAGFIVAGSPVTEAVELSDAVMVVTVATSTGTVPATVDVEASHYLQIRILKADGTTAVLNITGKYDPTTGDAEYIADAMNKTAVEAYLQPGAICTYVEDDAPGYYLLAQYTGEGEYGIAMIDDATINKGLASGKVSTADEEDGTFDEGVDGSVRFANDANIFVLATKDGANKYAVVKGSEVSKWAKDGGYAAAEGSLLLAATSANGFTYVQQGFLILDNEKNIPGQSTATSAGYGIVTANAARVYDSNTKDYVLTMTIWNGAEEIEILTNEAYSNAETKNYTAGTVVAYIDNNNGTISELEALTSVNAVTAWDEVDTIKFAKTPDALDSENGYEGGEDEFTITKDTVIVYIDKGNKTGANSGVISLATAHEDENGDFDGYYNNVYVATTADDEETIAYIIVDVTNQIAANSVTPVGGEGGDDGEDGDEEGDSHTHSYEWAAVESSDDDYSEHQDEHRGTCTSKTGTCDAEKIYHTAAEDADEKADDTHKDCILCQALSFSDDTEIEEEPEG